MISKKLLSKVLPNTERYTYKFIDGEPIQVDHKWQGVVGTLNLYELANLCKKWANKGNIAILSFEGFNSATATVYEGTSLNMFELIEIEANTEPEAVFKACEWVLEKRKDRH